MKAMVLQRLYDLQKESNPLESKDIPIPEPESGEILIQVSACGVCHTELDEIEGRTPPVSFPIVPGHQVVGVVSKKGPGSSRWKEGERVGVAWIYSACGTCNFCQTGSENLCEKFRGTGRDADGGYAELIRVREDFAFRIPDAFSAAEAAPLLCAGAIGFRSLRLAGLEDGQNLGLTGFGASGHIVLQLAQNLYPSSKLHVFARSEKEREFAIHLGAHSACDTSEQPPQKLHAIIDTTPVWKPVLEALKNLEPGGRLVINAIRKENVDLDVLLNLNYQLHLWMEKEIKSVANITRKDVDEFLNLAASIGIRPEFQTYPLEEANRALMEMKKSKIRGAKVLTM